MPMTLILGRVGCSKIGYMADLIARRIDQLQSGERITLIVPDQYTVASENYFISKLGERRIRHLNITSLKSLARTEFAAHGIPAQFIGEGGKTVLVKKAFDAVSPSLKYYPPEYRNPRFLPLLLGAIKELKVAGVEPEELMRTALAEGNDKLHDLSMIWQVYEEYLSEGYFDPDDAPARLCKLLEETGDFENEAVFVANFRTFYNRERKILLQMVRNGADVTISLPTDTIDPDTAGATADAAIEARELIARGRSMGEECRVDLRQAHARFPWAEFAFLEEETARPTGTVFEGEVEHIHLFRGADRFDEAEHAAAVIAQKVREEGYRYSDFAVIVRSLEDYAEVLDPVFDQYEIPLFYHRKTPLRRRNPMPFIAALFSLATEGLSRDTVLTFVKSGFCTTPEKASWFERYVTVWSVNYNRFKTPFLRPFGGFTDRETEGESVMRQGAEEVRRIVVETAEELASRTQHATVREISTVLYEILERLQVPCILEQNAENYRNYREYELAARQKKVYEQLILALDELVLTAGNDSISLKEYRDLFFAVIDTHDVAILPTSLDEVTAGSPETLPMTSPRCVFLLGLNEGVFPRNIEENRLLTDTDRLQLSPFGMGETTDDKILHEMFYVYSSLTAPREELYLSYALVAGGELAPSPVVERIREQFPHLKTERFSANDPESLRERIQRERAAFSLYSKVPVTELEHYFSQRPEYARILSHREEVSALSEETTRRIYPKHLAVSASRTDVYHQCRYAYFVRYSMGINPRLNADLNPLYRGTIIHEALESIIARGMDCSPEELCRRVDEYGETQLKKFYGDERPPDAMSNYFRVLMEKIKRILLLFQKEFAASQFVPVAFEQPIGFGENAVDSVTIPLEDGSLSLIGVVDRVDVYERDGKKYIRVIDYKSGRKEFSFKKVKNGIDIQMLMYLFALQQNLYPHGVCVPAGIQYVGANPGIASVSRNLSPELAMIQWEKKMPRSGLYLDDDGILNAMDGTEEKIFINISVKGKKSPSLVTQERFGELFEEICTTLRKMGDALHQGKIDKNPIRIGSAYCSCDRCDLKRYCRHSEPRNALAIQDEDGKEN